jgi:hypothetical protein
MGFGAVRRGGACPPSGLSGSLREVVLAGPASAVVLADQGASGALAVVACPVQVAAKAGHLDKRGRR